MPSVDDRVVQLRFENAQFEKGVSTSMNTLDKLDSKIKTGVSGTALLTLGNAAEKVAGKFSAMEIAGITAISNLANRAVDAGIKLISAVPNQIVSGGKARALNIENAKFQLKGLGVAWEDISKQIDYGVKDTAYGLDAAAKVASQLVASGVEFIKGADPAAGAIDDMSRALRGISGVAAMTNSSYEEIGSIFTTVAGQGKLMTMQLRQLEARGLNVAAKLGDVLGKTESEIRDMVTKGKIDFVTFSNAMDEAFGEHAKEANETFEGALSNMKAALSRIGADFATPILTRSRDIFNALREAFNGVRTITRPFAEGKFTTNFGKIVDVIVDLIGKFDASKLEPYARAVGYLSDAIVNFVRGVTPIASGMKEIWNSIFPDSLGDTIAKISGRVYRFSLLFRRALTGFTTDQEMAETLGLGNVDTEEAAKNAVQTVDDVYSEIDKAVEEKAKEVIQGKYGNGAERFAALEAEGYSVALVQNKVNELLNNAFRDAVGEGDYQKMAELLGLVFEETSDNSEEAADAIENVERQTTSTSQKILNTFKGLVSVIDLVKTAFSAFKQVFIDPLKTGRLPRILSNLLTLTSNWGSSFSDWVQKIKEEGTLIQFFEDIRTNLENAGAAVTTFFTTLWSRAQESESFQRLVASFNQFTQSLQTLKTNVLENFSTLMANINTQAEKLGFTLPEIAAGGLMDGLLAALDWVFEKLNSIVNFISPAIDFISEKLDGLFAVFDSINLSNFINGVGPLFEVSFSEIFGTPTEIVDSFLSSIFGLFGSAKDTISPIISSAADNTSEFISNLDSLAPAVETVTGVIDSTKDTAESIISVIDGVGSAIDTVSSAATSAEEAIAPIVDTVGEVSDVFGEYLGVVHKVMAPSRTTNKRPQIARDLEAESEEIGEALAVAETTVDDVNALRDSTENASYSVFSIFEALIQATPGVNLLYSAIQKVSAKFKNAEIGSAIEGWFSTGGLMDVLISVWDWIKRSGSNFANFIATLSHGEIYSLLSGIGALIGLRGLTNMFKSVSGIFTAASNVITGLSRSVQTIVSSITGTMNNALKTVRRSQTAKILLSLAVLIGVIVGSIWLISTIEPDRLMTAAFIVGIIGIYVAIVAGILSSIANKAKATSDYRGIGVLLIGMGIAIAALAGSLKILETVQLSWALLGKVLLLTGLVTVMVFAIGAISAAGIGTVGAGIGAAIAMIGFVGAMALLVKALEAIARANFKGIGDNLFVVLTTIGILSLISRIIGAGGFGRAVGLTLMIADIWLIVFALQSLAKVDTASLIRAFPAFMEVIVAMGVMMITTRLAGEHAAGAGIGILAMALSLLVVARVLKKLSVLDENDLKKAVGAVEGILALYALIMAASHVSKGLSLLAAGASFLLIAASLNILYFAIKNFANLADSSESYDKAMVSVYVLMAFFALFEALSAIASPGKVILTALSCAAVLLSIFGLFWLLKKNNIRGEEMIKQAAAIETIFVGLIGIITAATILGKIPGALGSLAKGVLAIDLVVADLVLLVAGIGAIINAVNGESALNTGIDVLTKIADFVNEYGITFGLVTAACIGLGLAVEATGPAILLGVAGIDLIVADLALLFTALSVFADNEGNVPLIEAGVATATAIGDGLGRFVGAISGGYDQAKMERQGEGVESLSASLENATSGLESFTSAIDGLDTNSVANVDTLAGAIGTMSDAGKKFKVKYADNFSQALDLYGTAAATFFTIMSDSGINAYSASKFSEALSNLTSIAEFAVPGAFDSEQFSKFVEGLRQYITAIVGLLYWINLDSFTIDDKKIESVVNAGASMASLYDSIPSTGGGLQKFTGEKSLADFASDIGRYIYALKWVDYWITGFEPDLDAWTYFVDIGAKFNEILNDIGYVFAGGVDNAQISVFGILAGQTSLETFAKDISDYVNAIIAVNDILVGLNQKVFYAGSTVGYLTEEEDYVWSDSWDMLVTIGQKMSELYKSLPGYLPEEDTGFFERIGAFLTRNKDGMSEFGADLSAYILAMVAVNDEINASGLTAESLNVDVLDAVASVARDWTDIAKDLSDVNTYDLRSLGMSLGGADTGFMLGFQNFYDTVSTMDMSVITAAVADIKTIISDLVDLAAVDATGIDDLSSVSSALGDLGDTFSVAFATSFAQNAGALIEIGSGITATIGEGILENSETLTSAASNVSAEGATAATERVGLYTIAGIALISAMIISMESFSNRLWTSGYTLAGQVSLGASSRYTSFWYAGYYMAYGVIKGISYQYGALYNAGVAMANQALKGVSDAAAIASPSKVTTQYGMYLGEGLVNGLHNSEGNISSAAEGLTNSMLDSLNSVVRYVYDILAGALDYDMTIRPVVDLSNVRAGAEELSGLFGADRYNLGDGIYMPRLVAGKIQNEGTSDVKSPMASITNNFYVQKMDEGMVDYFVARINTELGARV